MNIRLIKVLGFCFLVSIFQSCDINKFLEDLAAATEQPQDQRGQDQTGNDTRTVPADDKRTTERNSGVETRTADGNEMEMIIVQLDLSEEQLADYRKINDKYNVQIENVKQSDSTADKKAKDIKYLRYKQEKETFGLLTPAQVDKYNQLKNKDSGDFKRG